MFDRNQETLESNMCTRR